MECCRILACENPYADASFLYAKESSLTGPTGSVLRDGSGVTTLDNVCALSSLRRDVTTVLSSNRTRNVIRRVRDVVALLTK